MSRMNTLLGVLACALLAVSAAPAMAQCPHEFKLKGKITQDWGDVGGTEWTNMLTKGEWADNGQHFYAQVKKRGPDSGINTPSDLESAIRGGTTSASRDAGRWRIDLNITNSRGQRLYVFYDYAPPKGACELVTFSYE